MGDLTMGHDRASASRLALRWLALVAMSVWLGGFTFYGAVVIPILHDAMGSDFEAGMVTRQVTNPLNAIGAATVVVWWVMLGVERSGGSPKAAWGRAALLAISTAVLVGLIALHPVMDARLDTGPLRGFYPLHKVYLNASTAQWAANLGLLATSLLVWRPPTRPLA